MTVNDAYVLLLKKIKGVASGVQSTSVDGTTLKFTFTDGSTQDITFPTPEDGVSVVDVDLNDYGKIVCTMSDGSTVVSKNGIKNGEDGVSPIVSTATITNGNRVSITDKDGLKQFDVLNGKDFKYDDFTQEQLEGLKGDDGISPTVTITEATNRHTVSITDKDGVKSFVVKDGTPEDLQNYYTKDETDTKLNDKANKTDIPTVPTNVSELTNDAEYIKNTVENLVNYYKKTETYTQDEVNNLLSNLNKVTTKIIDELPTENIDVSTIYLKPVADKDNVYMQYMYINSAWAELGTTAVDLTNVYTKTEVDTKLNTKADKDEIPTVPTKVSELTNDSGYLTEYTETDPTVPAWAKADTKPTYTAQEVGALPDDTEVPVFTNKTVLDKITQDMLDSVHTHDNKEVIDKFTESDEGEVLYNGKQIASGNLWNGTKAQYDAIGTKDAETTYIVTDEEDKPLGIFIDDNNTSDSKTWSSQKIATLQKQYVTIPIKSISATLTANSSTPTYWENDLILKSLIPDGATYTRWRYIITGVSQSSGTLKIGKTTIELKNDQVEQGASYPLVSNWVAVETNALINIVPSVTFYAKEFSVQIEYVIK